MIVYSEDSVESDSSKDKQWKRSVCASNDRQQVFPDKLVEQSSSSLGKVD